MRIPTFPNPDLPQKNSSARFKFPFCFLSDFGKQPFFGHFSFISVFYISLFCSLFLCLTFSCSALTLSGNRKCFKLLDRLWGKQKRPQSDFLADCSNQADCSNFKTLGLFALNVLGQSLSGSFQNRSISLTSCLFGYSFPL